MKRRLQFPRWKQNNVFGIIERYNSDADVLFQRQATVPPKTVRKLVDNLFKGFANEGQPLNSSGPFDAFYSPLSSPLLNWVSTSYTLTPQGSVTTTPYKSFKGNGVDSYYSTGFNPSTAGGKLLQNSASLFIWSLTDATGISLDDAGNTALRINSRGSSTPFVRCNSNAVTNVAASDSLGLTAVSRIGSSDFRYFKNNTVNSVITAASIAPTNAEITISRVNANFSPRELAFIGFGGGLSGTAMTSLYPHMAAFVQGMQSFFFDGLAAELGSPDLIDLSARKGLDFGTSIQSATRMSRKGATPSTTLYDFVEKKFSLQVTGIHFMPDVFQPTQGNFVTTGAVDLLQRAAAKNIPVRIHSLAYPKRCAETGNFADSFTTTTQCYDYIDSHFEAIAAVPGIENAVDFDVINEIVNGSGNRTDNVFYRVFGDHSYLVYMYQKAQDLFGTGKNYQWCQDNTERAFDAYDDTARSNVLAALTTAISNGAPITGYNFQSHLRFSDGLINRAKMKTFVEALIALGLKITVGELDVRTGYDPVYRPNQKSPLLYTKEEYDREAYFLMRSWLDFILPYVVSTGGSFLCWSASDISHSWEFYNGLPSGERPSIYDTEYNKKDQWYAIRDSLLLLADA